MIHGTDLIGNKMGETILVSSSSHQSKYIMEGITKANALVCLEIMMLGIEDPQIIIIIINICV